MVDKYTETLSNHRQESSSCISIILDPVELVNVKFYFRQYDYVVLYVPVLYRVSGTVQGKSPMMGRLKSVPFCKQVI